MTVLLTGATGLVGPRLLPRLIEAGISCRALVRPGRDLPDVVERAEGDLDDSRSLEQALHDVSAVVHLAALFRTRDDDAIWRVNHEGTKNLIDAAKRISPEARFVMASTSNVYATDLDRPAREDDPTTTANAYAASKVAAEQDLRASGLTWAVLRFPFVYGDGDGHIHDAVAPLAQMGAHPAQRFSVLHHEDLAEAVRLALGGAMDSRVVNIAGDAPLSVFEMAQLVGVPFESSAQPLVNPWSGQVDASLAARIGFAPRMLTVAQAARAQRL
ncbi:MAG: NAD-dependent epimerase/dehydratase family protein [Nocardioidaceae bacterium]